MRFHVDGDGFDHTVDLDECVFCNKRSKKFLMHPCSRGNHLTWELSPINQKAKNKKEGVLVEKVNWSDIFSQVAD